MVLRNQSLVEVPAHVRGDDVKEKCDKYLAEALRYGDLRKAEAEKLSKS